MSAINNDWLDALKGEFKKPYYKELFNILYNYNKEAVGGTVIDESIYYK